MNTKPLLPLLLAMFCWLNTVHSRVINTENWTICDPCQSHEECDESPSEVCIWGEARDACNRRICAKGPGESCGGTHNYRGICGEGMMCKSDEKCYGCSIQTLECFN